MDLSGNGAPTRAYLVAFVLVGVSMSTTGFALSRLREQAGGVGNGSISWLLFAGAVGYVVGSLSAGRGLDSGWGHRMWVASMAVIVVSWGVIAAASTLWLMVAASGVIGMAAGMADAVGNTLVVWSRPDGSGTLLNALHLSFALGVMACPVILRVSFALGDRLWGAVAAMAVIAAASSVPMLRHPPPRQTRLEVAARSAAGGARGRHVVLVCAFFFAYVAYETTFINWIATYTEEIGYTTAVTGVSFMAGAGFTLGRVIAVPAASRFSAGAILATTLVGSLAVLAVFVAAAGEGPLLWAIAFVFGAMVAPQYAAMMGFAESHLALSGRITSAIVATSGLGALVMPRIMGELFDRRGPDTFPGILVVLGLVTVVAALVVGRSLGRTPRHADEHAT
ncbi:MAG: MFS transporter [Ilumatobacteraceae bacterium]